MNKDATSELMHPQCLQCDALCCRYYCLAIPQPQTYEDFDEVRWYLMHAGSSVHVDFDGDWWLKVHSPCQMLRQTPAGPRCVAYDDRPIACRALHPDRCHFSQGEPQYDQEFRTAEELDAFAQAMLGEDEYLRQQALARQQAGSEET